MNNYIATTTMITIPIGLNCQFKLENLMYISDNLIAVDEI